MSEQIIPFNFQAREWQKKVFAMQKRYTVLAVHRRAGKTTLAVAELILKALKTTGLYAYIAPELKQARLIAWDLLKDMCRQFDGFIVKDAHGNKVPLTVIHETEPYVQFGTGARIMLFGADKPDRVRGVKLAGAIIDEVAQMPRTMWSEIVRPALMDSKGWALFIGTPKGMNLFSELYDYGGRFPDWVSAKFTCYETGAIDPDEIEAYKREVSEEEFNREMLCDFTASASNQLISLFTAQQAAHKTINPNYLGRTPLLLGVDVARFGDDRSVLCFRRGLLAEEPIVYKDVDTYNLALIVKRHVEERHPRAIFVDGTGMGCGVVDTLTNMGIFVYDVNFGKGALNKLYVNRRTEMWCKMAQWLEHGGILPDNADLVQELALPTYDVNERMQKELESKKDIRERAGRSPDLADALALTFAEDITNEEEQHFAQDRWGNDIFKQEQTRVQDYSPFRAYRNSRLNRGWWAR